jgi:hypothetical protein
MSEWTVPLLRDALERIASSAPEQERNLREFGTWPSNDELALELDDIREAAVQHLSNVVRGAVAALDAHFDAMSGPNPVWDGPSLYTAPEWARARELAREALALMDAEREPSRA